MENNPSYYAVIPANVRYSTIPDGAKLLYWEITALTHSTWECYASNEYFASLYWVDERTIRRWREALEWEEFIFSEEKNGKRVIKIPNSECPGGGQKCPGGRTKMSGGADKNVRHNNTYNNTLNNNNKKNNGENDKIDNIEDFRSSIDREKIEKEFFYKIDSDHSWEMFTYDCFSHFIEKWKEISKKYATERFRRWLLPTYETEEERELMRKNWKKAQMKKNNVSLYKIPEETHWYTDWKEKEKEFFDKKKKFFLSLEPIQQEFFKNDSLIRFPTAIKDRIKPEILEKIIESTAISKAWETREKNI